MGKPMALHLANHQLDVTVYNRTYEKALLLKPHCKVSDNLIEAVKDKDLIFSIVGYPDDVKNVYETIIPHAKKGAILVDMTTSSPTLAIELYNLAKAHNLYMLDAPVTGGDTGAINASLSIMVGGYEAIYLRVLPYLKMMGKTITYMGKPGNGQYMKLANQIVIAGNLLGIAEGLAFAQSHNLDLSKVLNVVTGGSANSWQASNNGKKMIEKDYQPGFYVKHFLKDLRLAIDNSNLELEVLHAAEKTYNLLSELHSDDGTQVVIEHYIKKAL